jgi:hypothetical protein
MAALLARFDADPALDAHLRHDHAIYGAAVALFERQVIAHRARSRGA